METMTPQTAILKARQRLNKIASSDYDNIPDWSVIEALNKGQLSWVRRQIHGENQMREGDEQTSMRVNDLQILLTPLDLTGRANNLFYQTKQLPANFLFLKRVTPIASSDCCTGIRLKSELVEEANVDVLLDDWSWKPSIEWKSTFHTMVGNTLRIYTSGRFHIDKVPILYYRLPQQVDIAGYTHETGLVSSNVNIEFKDDIAELIVDEAVSILAADIESGNIRQAAQTRVEQNN